MDLMKIVTDRLDDDALGKLSRLVGGGERETRNAIESALPLLVAGLGKNARTGNAASIQKAVEKDHDGSILDNLSAFLGQGPSSRDNRIVDHVFGQRRSPIEQGVAQSSGLSGEGVTRLMAALAPMVMGALGRQQSSGGSSLQDLVGALSSAEGNARQQPGAGALAGLLDGDGDGDVDIRDLAKLGTGLLGKFLRR